VWIAGTHRPNFYFQPQMIERTIFVFFILHCLCRRLGLLTVDFGSEFMKMSLAQEKALSFELVLNEQSARKSDAVVAFDKQNIRQFSTLAKAVEVRHPEDAVRSVSLMLGESLATLETHFPYNRFVANDTRRAVEIVVRNEMRFTVEEVAAMLLEFAVSTAQLHAATRPPLKIAQLVIVVPSFFNEANMRALSDAARIANLDLLGMVPDSHAVAVAYALEHSKSLEDGVTRTVAFVDIGASSARVTLAAVTSDSVRVLTSRSERRVSGRAVDALLADLACASVPCAKSTVARVRLLRAAERAKIVLSVNKFAVMRVPASNANAADDADSTVDFTVTRAMLDDALAPACDLLAGLVEDALRETSIDKSQIDLVEIVGGSTRVPVFQAALSSVLGREASYHVNSDEGVLYGAAYLAASLVPAPELETRLKVVDGAAFPASPSALTDGELKSSRYEVFVDLAHESFFQCCFG
jgi:hypoxia up-regulated 1